MKICLINPAGHFVSKMDISLFHNLALGYQAGYLRQDSRHEVSIIDALAEGYRHIHHNTDGTFRVGLTLEQTVKRIPQGVELIGVAVPFTYLAGEARQLCAEIKRCLPHIPLLAGGVHPTVCPDDFSRWPVDYWLMGEGELALQSLADGQPPEQIPGLLSRRRPDPAQAGLAQQIDNLDELPFPARDLMPGYPYDSASYRSGKSRIHNKRTAQVITSRGYPWDGSFCTARPQRDYRWRWRSADNILREIRSLMEEDHIQHIEFLDDTLTLHRKRAVELFEGIVNLRYQLKTDLTWSLPNGIIHETVNRDLLKMMMRSGCVQIVYVLDQDESHIPAPRRRKPNSEMFERAICNSIDIGLRVEIFTLVGYPGETRQRFENAMTYYRQLYDWGVTKIHFGYPQPWPGTQLNRYCRERGYQVADDRSLLPEIKIVTDDFDIAEVRRRREALLAEVDRNSRIRRRVKALLPRQIMDILNRYLPQETA